MTSGWETQWAYSDNPGARTGHSFQDYQTATYLGVDFHGKKEAEVGVWGETVELLLKLDKPLWSQVYVLQHDPTTRLGRGIDSLVGLTEPFGRPCSMSIVQRVALNKTILHTLCPKNKRPPFCFLINSVKN